MRNSMYPGGKLCCRLIVYSSSIDSKKNFLSKILSNGVITSKMKSRNANFESKSRDTQHALIAKNAQIPIEQVRYAMMDLSDDQGTKVLTEQYFLSIMKALKKIEDKL